MNFSGKSGEKVAHKPDSVLSSHSSGTAVACSLKRSTRMRRMGDPYLPRQMAFLLDLAPRGVCRAGRVTVTPVGSYSAFSPFPDKSGSLFSAALSVASLLLAVSQPSALKSPDFPLKIQRLEVLLFHKLKELIFVFRSRFRVVFTRD